MEVILDTNFIISCLLLKIDFISQLQEEGFTRILVPKEVIGELKDLKINSKSSQAERAAINTALILLEHKLVKKTELGTKTVDEGLLKMGKKGFYIATVDGGINRQIPNKVIILRAKKSIGIERV